MTELDDNFPDQTSKPADSLEKDFPKIRMNNPQYCQSKSLD